MFSRESPDSKIIPLVSRGLEKSSLLLVFVYSQKGKDVPPKKDPVSTLQSLLGPLPRLNVSGHLLGVQLMSVNAYLHTSILYGQWEGWHGRPVNEPPMFYNGLTEPAADLLSSISDEIVKIAKLIELNTAADMSHVRVFNILKKLIFKFCFSHRLDFV